MILFSLAAGMIFVAAFCYMFVLTLANAKHKADTVQFKANQAGAAAVAMGFKLFDDLLFWFGAGNIKECRRVLHEIWTKYCQDERGPVRLARDIFMHTWAKLRVDKEFGNEVRQEVVHEALNIDINDKTDVVVARAAERADKIGWTKVGTMGLRWAEREWGPFSAAVQSLFGEFMEPDGEKKIASRVMRPTLEALWDDPKFRPGAEALVREYFAKAEQDLAAKNAESLKIAKAMLAAEVKAA